MNTGAIQQVEDIVFPDFDAADIEALLAISRGAMSKPRVVTDDALKVKGLGSDWLRRLRAFWSEYAAATFHPAYMLYGPTIGKRRLQQAMGKGLGYRNREHGRLLPEDQPYKALGTDDGAVRHQVVQLAAWETDLVVVPSSRDRGLVGSPVYPWGNPPNPYMWVPAIAGRSPKGGLIWEMGVGLSSSAEVVAGMLDRNVIMMRLPHPESCEHHARIAYRTPTYNPKALPDLVLVPLVVPCDAFSFSQTIRLVILHRQEEVWIRGPGEDITEMHPEFAVTPNAYVTTALARLATLDRLVQQNGTKVVTSTPMVLGVPHGLEEAVQARLRWRVASRYTVIEEGGRKHVFDGRPLIGEQVVVWEAR